MMWRLSHMAMTFPMKFFSSNGFLSNSGSGTITHWPNLTGGNRCFDLSFIFSPVFVTPASAASLYFTIDCDVEQNWQIIPLSRTTWNPFVNESPQTEHCFIAEDSFYVTWDSISVPLLNLGSVCSLTLKDQTHILRPTFLPVFPSVFYGLRASKTLILIDRSFQIIDLCFELAEMKNKVSHGFRWLCQVMCVHFWPKGILV